MPRAVSMGFLIVLLAALPGQSPQAQTGGGRCGCDCGELVDADGNLNPEHCDASRVMEILNGYTQRSSHLLSERVQPEEITLLERTKSGLRSETVGDLLYLMTLDELARFLPVLAGPEPPPPGPPRPGTWPGGQEYACEQAVFWINTALDLAVGVEQIIFNFEYEQSMYTTNPSNSCPPNLVGASDYYAGSTDSYYEARQWLQYAADSMSNQFPALAKFFAHAGWWSSGYAGFGFMVAFNQPTVSGDPRCTEIADIGLALVPVAQAAKQGYEWTEKCAPGGLF